MDGNYTKLSYSGEKSTVLYPLEFKVGAEYMQYDAIFDEGVTSFKVDCFIKQGFLFMENRSFNVRVYAGFLPLRPEVNSTTSNNTSVGNNNINLVFNNDADHSFEEYFIGRTETSGLWDNQVLVRDGGFKLANTNAGNLGQTDLGAFSVNIDTHIPIKAVPRVVRLYFDYGSYYISRSASGGEWENIASGGVMLNVLDFFNVYVPVWSSESILINQQNPTFFNQISFTLDMNKLNIIDLYNNFRI